MQNLHSISHQDLLHQAVSLTHLTAEDTVDLALQFFIEKTKSAAALRDYRGKIDLGLNIQNLREDRP